VGTEERLVFEKIARSNSTSSTNGTEAEAAPSHIGQDGREHVIDADSSGREVGRSKVDDLNGVCDEQAGNTRVLSIGLLYSEFGYGNKRVVVRTYCKIGVAETWKMEDLGSVGNGARCRRVHMDGDHEEEGRADGEIRKLSNVSGATGCLTLSRAHGSWNNVASPATSLKDAWKNIKHRNGAKRCIGWTIVRDIDGVGEI
jgi:hypothetical protein